MRRSLSLALAGLVLLALGGVVGRATAPTSILEEKRIDSGETKGETKASTSSSSSAAAVDRNTATKVSRKNIRRPDGTVENTETIETKAGTHAEAKAADKKKELDVHFVDRWNKVETIKLVEAARPQWEVGLLFGYGVVGARPTYGGFLERRILGGIKAGAFVTSEKAFGAMIGFEW